MSGKAKADLRVAALEEGLRWALAELDGQTRYDNDEQIENCYVLAYAALGEYTSLVVDVEQMAMDLLIKHNGTKGINRDNLTPVAAINAIAEALRGSALRTAARSGGGE